MFKRQVFKCLVFFLFSAMGMILVLDTSLGQVRFEDPINLSYETGESWSPSIAAVDDQVFVFWHYQVSEKSSDIQLAHSRDKGMNFRIWNLSPGIKYSYVPKVVAEGDNIYVGWPGRDDFRDITTAAPFLSRSNDGGESFEPPYDISGRNAAGEPIMRIQDGILNVAWTGHDQESGFPDVLFARSTDFGETFSEPVTVSDIALRRWWKGSSPVFGLDGDQVYVAWMGGKPNTEFYDIHFARSTDAGESFSQTTSLSERTREKEATTGPQLAVGDKGYVYVAWAQGLFSPPLSPLDIYFRRSTDGGETFDERLNLSNNPQASNRVPKMVASGDNVYIAWYGISGGASNIFFSRSTDGGETFSEPKNISNSPRGAAHVQIMVIEKGKLLEEGINEDVIYLVWQDSTPGNDSIFFSVSLDGGATFSEPENISNNRGYAGGPQIAAVGRSVYVTYMGGALGSFNAFFIRGELELDSKSHRFRE